MAELETEFLFELRAELDAGQPVGGGPNGDRRIVYVTGGSFEGPHLRGEVLPGGGDWLLRRPDGVSVLDVRITLRTDDEALIYMTYRGLMHGLPTHPGESETEERYFRTTPSFETAAEQYAWLNRIVAVGVGEGRQGGVGYRVYAVR